MVLDYVISPGLRICQFRVSLEPIEFLEFFSIVRGRDISSRLSLAKSGSGRLVYHSSSFFGACSLSQLYFCSFMHFLQAPTVNPLRIFIVHSFILL